MSKKSIFTFFTLFLVSIAAFAIPSREVVFIKIESFIQKHKTDPLHVTLRSVVADHGLKIDCITTEKNCPGDTGVYWAFENSDGNELRLHFKFKKLEALTLKDFKREFDFATFHAGLPELKTSGWVVRQLDDDAEKENKVELTEFSNGILKGKITSNIGVIDATLQDLPPECQMPESRRSLRCGKNFEAHLPTEINFELAVDQRAVHR